VPVAGGKQRNRAGDQKAEGVQRKKKGEKIRRTDLENLKSPGVSQ
jgi:hypothetical protein